MHTKHSQKVGPFLVARLKMDLPFHNRLAYNRVHRRSASPLPWAVILSLPHPPNQPASFIIHLRHVDVTLNPLVGRRGAAEDSARSEHKNNTCRRPTMAEADGPRRRRSAARGKCKVGHIITAHSWFLVSKAAKAPTLRFGVMMTWLNCNTGGGRR